MRLFTSDLSAKTDEQLMNLILNKNQNAFEELYDRYASKMLFFLIRMLNYDKEKANDFLQDLFLKIIERPNLFNPEKKFAAWFYSVAVNMCKNEYKRLNIHQEEMLTDNVPDRKSEASYSDIIDLNSFSDELSIYLDELDPEHKTIFLLRYGNELSIKEIAGILHCPEGTVKSRLHYTIKYLSEKLTIYKSGVN